MAQVNLIRLPNGDLRPIGDESIRCVRRFEDGEIVPAEIKKQRNVKFHRKFMALCQVVAEYSDIYDNTDKAMHAIKIAAGHCDFVVNPVSGVLEAHPKSISFAAMDDLAFEVFYKNAIQGVLSFILPTMDEESMEIALEQVVVF